MASSEHVSRMRSNDEKICTISWTPEYDGPCLNIAEWVAIENPEDIQCQDCHERYLQIDPESAGNCYQRIVDL